MGGSRDERYVGEIGGRPFGFEIRHATDHRQRVAHSNQSSFTLTTVFIEGKLELGRVAMNDMHVLPAPFLETLAGDLE